MKIDRQGWIQNRLIKDPCRYTCTSTPTPTHTQTHTHTHTHRLSPPRRGNARLQSSRWKDFSGPGLSRVINDNNGIILPFPACVHTHTRAHTHIDTHTQPTRPISMATALWPHLILCPETQKPIKQGHERSHTTTSFVWGKVAILRCAFVGKKNQRCKLSLKKENVPWHMPVAFPEWDQRPFWTPERKRKQERQFKGRRGKHGWVLWGTQSKWQP